MQGQKEIKDNLTLDLTGCSTLKDIKKELLKTKKEKKILDELNNYIQKKREKERDMLKRLDSFPHIFKLFEKCKEDINNFH